jgi:hypothetical protein
MCFFNSRAPAEPPAPAAAPETVATAGNRAPVLQNQYDPSSPESGVAAEKGSAMNRAKGTSQLRVDLDPTLANVGKQTGLQINK